MRFVQPAVVLLGVPTYLGVFAILGSEGGTDEQVWLLTIAGAWNLVMLVATVVALVDSIRRVRAGKTRQLALDAMIVKLASIPFFLVNFAVLVLVFNVSLRFIMIGPVFWAIIAVGIVLTYLTMLSTSIPAWATITQLRRERVIGTGLTVLYVILSLLFVTDIAVGVLLFGHSRRRPRLALVWLLVGTGVALILVAIFDAWLNFLEFDFPYLNSDGLHAWVLWVIPLSAGVAVVLVTVIISALRRSSLRDEARRATLVVDAGTASDGSSLNLAD